MSGDSTDDVSININLTLGDITVHKESGGKPKDPVVALIRGALDGRTVSRPDSDPEPMEDPYDEFGDLPSAEIPGNLMNRWPEDAGQFGYSEATDEDGVPDYAFCRGRALLDEGENLDDQETLALHRSSARAAAESMAVDTGYTQVVSETHNFFTRDGKVWHCYAIIFGKAEGFGEFDIDVEFEEDDSE